ncbi:hypothetical protein [Pedobacter sp. MR2016-24]|nr:hypothetical protein [Pedobacter sp. MR2016-24]MCX2483147.1 hypothetical protein [Pedobacter sp. MR2016-24]
MWNKEIASEPGTSTFKNHRQMLAAILNTLKSCNTQADKNDILF